jgi:hypothetical protein
VVGATKVSHVVVVVVDVVLSTGSGPRIASYELAS